MYNNILMASKCPVDKYADWDDSWWLAQSLTFTTLWVKSACDKLMILLFFPENIVMETICTKCQILFSREKKPKQTKPIIEQARDKAYR